MTEIAFDDIRVGDTIRAIHKKGTGESATYEGTVKAVADDYVDTMSFSFYRHSGYTYELLSRPVPEEPKNLGAVVLADGKPFVNTYDSDGLPWRNPDYGYISWSDILQDYKTVEIKSEGVVL